MFGRAISLEQVSAITNFSGSDPLMPIQSNNKVTVALEAMSRGTQRCIITNEKGEFTGILARTDIIHYIAENIGMLKESANIPISELGLVKYQNRFLLLIFIYLFIREKRKRLLSLKQLMF